MTRPTVPPLYTLLRRQVRLVPDAVAVTKAEFSLTYRELFRRADWSSAALRTRDLPPETLVGLRSAPGPGLAVALIGVLGAGAAFAVVDPDGPPHSDIVLDTEAPPAGPTPPHGPLPAPPAAPERVVCAVTGPHGKPPARFTDTELTRALLAERDALGLGPGDTVLHRTPPHQAFGVVEVLLTLLSGARLAIPDTPDHDDIAAALEAMTQHHTTHVRLSKAMLLDSLGLSSLAAFHLLRAGFSQKAVWTTPDLDAGTRARIEARTRFPLRPVAENGGVPAAPADATGLHRLLVPQPSSAAPTAAVLDRGEPVRAEQYGTSADTALLQLVTNCWQEVLEGVGLAAHDDFFACGGNSLSAVLATDTVAERLGRDVPVDLVFQHRTPTAYAAALTVAGRTDRAGAPTTPAAGTPVRPPEGTS